MPIGARPSVIRLLPLALLLLGGCAGRFGGPKPRVNIEPGLSHDQLESRSLTNLAILEMALDDYKKREGKVPEDLKALAPRYLAELPVVALGIPGHPITSEVEPYPAEVFQDGEVQASRLRDTGRWAYVRSAQGNDAVVFIDCTHFSSRAKAWFKEKGAL